MPATWRLDPPYRIAAFAGVLAVLIFSLASFAVFASFITPEQAVATPSTHIYAGAVDKYAVGEPIYFAKEHVWLVKQPDGTFLALYDKAATFRGCSVPWRATFNFTDPRTGIRSAGWFRDPCSGATYDINGVRVFGPSPRDLDRYPVKIENGNVVISVSPASLIKGPVSGPIVAR